MVGALESAIVGTNQSPESFAVITRSDQRRSVYFGRTQIRLLLSATSVPCRPPFARCRRRRPHVVRCPSSVSFWSHAAGNAVGSDRGTDPLHDLFRSELPFATSTGRYVVLLSRSSTMPL